MTQTEAPQLEELPVIPTRKKLLWAVLAVVAAGVIGGGVAGGIIAVTDHHTASKPSAPLAYYMTGTVMPSETGCWTWAGGANGGPFKWYEAGDNQNGDVCLAGK